MEREERYMKRKRDREERKMKGKLGKILKRKRLGGERERWKESVETWKERDREEEYMYIKTKTLGGEKYKWKERIYIWKERERE